MKFILNLIGAIGISNIIAAIALAGSFIVVRIQVRKVKKAKWIDDLRDEISELMAISSGMESSAYTGIALYEKYAKFDKYAIKVQFSLDETIPDQKQLYDLVGAFVIFVMSQENVLHENSAVEYSIRRNQIRDLGKQVITTELKKYNSFF